jgi:hypothetical protein
MTQPTIGARLIVRSLFEIPSMPALRLAPTFPTHFERGAIEGYLRHY